MHGARLTSILVLCLSLAACGDPMEPDDAGADAAVSDSGMGECTPGAMETLACGMCGTENRFCSTDGVWTSPGCEDEGVCMPAATEDIACGNCGTMTRVCTDACVWDESAACAGEGCMPGLVERNGDGCPMGQDREARCNDMCMFEGLSMCTDLACPTAGMRERVPCGTRCGDRERVCNAMLLWEYGACEGEGPCESGETGMAPCGDCGMQAATCGVACTWEPTGMCMAEGECSPGTMQLTSSGCAAHEARDATCDTMCTLTPTGTCTPLAPDPYIVVPPASTPIPARLTMSFLTSIGFADIYFLLDRTGSMFDEIDALRMNVVSIINSRSCADSGTACTLDSMCAATEVCSSITGTCIESPATSACVANLYSGVGEYETVYNNLLSLQSDPVMSMGALGRITLGGGTEALYEAVLGLADPSMSATETGCTGPTGGSIGCPAYRSNARRIAVVFTDEDSDGPTLVGPAAAALSAAEITLIGVWSGAPTGAQRAALEALVRMSGSFRSDGTTPHMYDGVGAAVVPLVEAALDDVLGAGTLRVTVQVDDDPSDAVDATQFVDHIETNTTSTGCDASSATADTDGDGFDDEFTAVMPGVRVCYDLVARQNDTVPATSIPQVYPVDITVLGDGAVLDTRRVSFIIPSVP